MNIWLWGQLFSHKEYVYTAFWSTSEHEGLSLPAQGDRLGLAGLVPAL